MTYLRESFCYQMWLTLLSVYDQSILHRCLVRLGAWCNAQVDESRILRVLCRQGAVARSWQESLACRAVTFLINLPAWLLHKLYAAFRMTFEDSFFARLAFSMGDETAIAQSWMIMLLWVIPFSHWNNAYSLMCCCWRCFMWVPCIRRGFGWMPRTSAFIRCCSSVRCFWQWHFPMCRPSRCAFCSTIFLRRFVYWSPLVQSAA